MDQDKIDKTIEFLLQNQAQFYAELQQTQELQKEWQKNSETRIKNLEQVSVNLLEAVKQTNETVKEVSKNVEELRAAQKDTDERLNAVIYMAEQFFSRGNGNPEQI